MNPVKALENHGQAIWLDFLARGFVAKGDLKKLIDTDGVKGVTSNPSIFEKAIGSSDEYDGAIGTALKKGDRPVAELFEHLAIEDIQNAADVLRPVYDALEGRRRFCQPRSIALSGDGHQRHRRRGRAPLEGRRPQEPDGQGAGDAGRPARDPAPDRRGHQHQHHAAVLARGLCRGRRSLSRGPGKIVEAGGDPSDVASVASFFVSRIDSAVDKELDEKIASANDPTEKERLAALKGKVAIANAKMAYQDYKRLFSGARWDKLAAKGARPQRLLWASTGTKNKDYSDVLYVEELIGPNTVNTVPPATLDAFRDHGTPRDSLEENIEDARPRARRTRKIRHLARRHHGRTGQGRRQAVRGCRRQALWRGRAQARGRARRRHRPAAAQARRALGKAVEKATEEWRASAKIRRLWQHDNSVWTGTTNTNGWAG